ncbi:MAG: Smr/MutS family protein, partial [Candidatus Zixiibacteriota bacterium]
LDSIHAAANLSIKIDGTKPGITKGSKIELIKARHPLMAYQVGKNDSVVANDFSLNDSRLALIITGPNTGGKTVALKTVGLLVLMAQSGLHIPADHHSEIGIFKNVIADIGDEQSIELSLSTFSSHVRQIIFAVRNARESSLILLDEIGAGTDPKEGSALAEAIILKMVELKAKLIVTTHYSQLKTLPMIQPEIENASFEFDRDSLAPTFKLYTGIPGGSYAVEIAQRLGMPRDIASHAANLIGKSERSLTSLIESLEKDLSVLKKDKVELEEKLRNAANLEKYYNEKIEKLEKEIDEIKKRRLEELESTLNETRGEVERVVKKIRESKAAPDTVKHAHKFLQQKKETLDKLKAKHQPKSEPSDKLMTGDSVVINSLRAEGEFVGMAGDDKAKVRVGNIMSIVELADLKRITGDAPGKKPAGAGGMREISAPGPEIDLRGMTVEEAREALDKFLDSAVLIGMHQLYVIHGKGTGKLRKELTEFLKRHSAVDSIRLGDWNEGGAGVTVVKMK